MSVSMNLPNLPMVPKHPFNFTITTRRITIESGMIRV